jgi:flagellin-like hook-associated protein FlgL
MMSSAVLSTILSKMSALDTLNSLQNDTSHSGMQQMRASPAKENKAAANGAVSLAIRSKAWRQSPDFAAKINSIADNMSLIGRAENGLSRIQNLLVKMRNQTEQAADNTVDPVERNAIQADVFHGIHEIEKVIGETPWKETKLLDGLIEVIDDTISIRTGVEGSKSIAVSSQNAELSGTGSRQSNLENTPKVSDNRSDAPARDDIAEDKEYFTTVRYVRMADFHVRVDSAEQAKESTVKIDGLIGAVTEKLRVLDAVRSQLAFKEGTLSLGQTNSELLYYRIMDGDMARAQLGTTKLQIFQQTPIAIATQANQATEEILSLFY